MRRRSAASAAGSLGMARYPRDAKVDRRRGLPGSVEQPIMRDRRDNSLSRQTRS